MESTNVKVFYTFVVSYNAFHLSAASLTAMFAAAADVLCAAFNQSNGVYMADAGTFCNVNSHFFPANFIYQANQVGSSSTYVQHVTPVRGQRWPQ